jgi:hypothetical protein
LNHNRFIGFNMFSDGHLDHTKLEAPNAGNAPGFAHDKGMGGGWNSRARLGEIASAAQRPLLPGSLKSLNDSEETATDPR